MALPESLRAPRLQKLYAYWDRSRGEARALSRAALDPITMPREALPYLILLEIVPETLDFQYRLVGTGVVEMLGRDFTGQRVSTYQARHETEDLISGYRHVVKHVEPRQYFGDLRNTGREYVRYECLALPVASRDDRINQVLAGVAFDPPLERDPIREDR